MPDPHESAVYVYAMCVNLSVNYYLYLAFFTVWVQSFSIYFVFFGVPS